MLILLSLMLRSGMRHQPVHGAEEAAPLPFLPTRNKWFPPHSIITQHLAVLNRYNVALTTSNRIIVIEMEPGFRLMLQ